MKTLLYVCSLVAILAVCVPVEAQPGPGGPGGGRRGMRMGGPQGGGIGMLLMNDGVRDELGLQQDQLDRLRELQDDIRAEMRDRFAGIRDLSPEERREAFADMRQEMEDLRADVESSIGEVLTESQMSRLRQIEVQQQVNRRGATALLSGPLAEKLGISDEQQEAMRQKAEEERVKLQEEIRKLTEQSRERVLSVLSESQRAQLKELMGKQFEMPQQQRARGMRGGRGGQDQGGRRGNRPELE